jgi:hypothetical protein
VFGDEHTITGHLLTIKPLCFVGLISYSLYLWHQPVFALAKHAEPIVGEIDPLALICFITFLSVATWSLIETPLRNKSLGTGGSVFSLSILATTLLAGFGYASYQSISVMENEREMAHTLKDAVAIFAPNMNERAFIKARIEVETTLPEIIVLGSSRAMQISEETAGKDLLNLAAAHQQWKTS